MVCCSSTRVDPLTRSVSVALSGIDWAGWKLVPVNHPPSDSHWSKGPLVQGSIAPSEGITVGKRRVTFGGHRPVWRPSLKESHRWPSLANFTILHWAWLSWKRVTQRGGDEEPADTPGAGHRGSPLVPRESGGSRNIKTWNVFSGLICGLWTAALPGVQ